MLNVALTGNVASGKSTVTGLFAKWGATVIDADLLVHELQQPGSPVTKAIVRQFGANMLTADGDLDRSRLRSVVFADPEARLKLNGIVHPAVQRRRADLADDAKSRGDCVLINDIPLLFEVLDPDEFDVVVLIEASPEVRRNRLLKTRALTSEDADRAMASQMPSSEKRSRADYIIENNESLEDLERSASDVWRPLRRRAAAHGAVSGARMLAIVAHPDDEALGMGGTLARYADAGVSIYLASATAGESGAQGDVPSQIGARRAKELQRSAAVLGVEEVRILGLTDGNVAQERPAALAALQSITRSFEPDVTLTFGPDGVTGHRDHVAVHQLAVSAWVSAGRPGGLHFITYPSAVADAVPGNLRGRALADIDVTLDIRPWRDVKKDAILCHENLTLPFGLYDPGVAALFEREWFVDHHPTGARRFDFFGV